MTKLCLVDEALIKTVAPTWSRDIEKEPVTPMELHLTRVLGGVHVAFLINGLVAIFQENSHYRAMAVLMEAVYLTFDSYALFKAKTQKGGGPVFALLGLSIIGLGVHAMEPGIFTKDKTKL
eukprot:CAMPEP_0198138154 /NCGR_PEP_ID=MMETSP1443-20131203/1569_1 /TAXON_ID=186043 /ORGANISM="Entomoneis sp., Strain CCMP2396" /LENGTH=120 /DNA_ID=CAMNT_0043799809 /DNA_START=130 /DNA_END=492 /DNA_ORIENTATION=-